MKALKKFSGVLFVILVISFSAAFAGSLDHEQNFGAKSNGVIPKSIVNIPGAKPVGNQVCFDCHPVAKFGEGTITPYFWKTNVHSNIAGTMKCEYCHGNGSKHVMANSSAFIINPAKMKDKWKAEETCTVCHFVNEPADMHGGTGVTCFDCHVFHAGVANPHYLKIQPERDLCYKCHPSIREEFNLPAHHPVNEGDMSCTSCHLAHFALASDNLVEHGTQETCGMCHPRERGPFVFQHITFGGCLRCHVAHGSAQQYMLTLPQPALCLQCHLASTDQFAFNYPFCTTCHVAIHGSNYQRLMQR